MRRLPYCYVLRACLRRSKLGDKALRTTNFIGDIEGTAPVRLLLARLALLVLYPTGVPCEPYGVTGSHPCTS